MFCLAGLLLTCLFQVAISQCVPGPALNLATGVSGWGRPNVPNPFSTMAPYGGNGIGDISVAGEMPVTGNTVLIGQIPVSGNVRFGGEIPAGGMFSVSGSCSCGLNGAIIN